MHLLGTEHKLEETHYFLDRLIDSYNTHPVFDYYLSAFISSARSVGWILNAECAKVPEWKKPRKS